MDNIEKIINWSNNKENIRALLLSGSMAGKSKKDILSDYDLAVYGVDFAFITDDSWLKEISDFWVCIPEKFHFYGYEIPTRLVIFDACFKVDFSFHPVKELETIIQSEDLPDDYNLGYKVLLDKDGFAKRLPYPTFRAFALKKPTDIEFQNNSKEFFFEVYHIAKYLFRNDLWTVKFRDWSSKEWLREMLEWNAACKKNWKFSPKNNGKEMSDWLDSNTWTELEGCFGNFNKESAQQALKNMIILYQKIAIETAADLNYLYNYRLSDEVSNFVEELGKVPGK